MRLITRYILNEFLKPFLLGMVAFASLLIISELFVQLDKWIELKTPILVSAEYLFWRTPEWLVQISPVAVLLATLFSLGGLARHNEITAMEASGISLYRIVLPLLILCLFFVLGSFLFSEVVVPYANQRVNYIYDVKVRHREIGNYQKQENLITAGEEGRMYTIKYLDAEKKVIEGVSVDQFNKNFELISQIQAKKAIWKDNHWIFYDGAFRRFEYGEIRTIREEKFEERVFYLPERLDYFCRKQEKPSEMNYLELKNYIAKFTKNGIPTIREKVALYSKISFPFSCFIIMLVGIPFALETSKSGKVMGFALSIIICFLYWGMFSVGKAIGENLVMPPVLAAWFANIIFGILGLFLISRIYK
jgi:lipopolysaccharide export system permease protein